MVRWSGDQGSGPPARRARRRASSTGRLAEALHIYVSAMGYPPGTARQRRTLWLDHSAAPAGARSAGWTRRTRCSASPTATPAARASGGSRRSGAGCATPARQAQLWLHDYFELTELHVRPDAQGRGLGEGLLRALLAGTGRARVLLSTPEYGDQTARPGLAALPAPRLPRRAARPPVHRRLPPVRGARPGAAARPAGARRTDRAGPPSDPRWHHGPVPPAPSPACRCCSP